MAETEIPQDVIALAAQIVGTSANTDAERTLVEEGIMADRASRAPVLVEALREIAEGKMADWRPRARAALSAIEAAQ